MLYNEQGISKASHAQAAMADELDSLGVLELQERLGRELNSIDGVAGHSFMGIIPPFSGNTWYNGNDDNGFELFYKAVFADEHYAAVADLQISEGRWLNLDDRTAKYPAIVVNRAFQEEFFPTVPTLVDSVIVTEGQTRVVGIVEDYKYGSNFAEREPMVFSGQSLDKIGEPSYARFTTIYLRTDPGRKADVQEAIYNTVVSLTKSPDVTIKDLAVAHQRANRPVLIPLVILALISAFLLINTALGLFGVLFNQISQRRAEIGLRKALGADTGSIIGQFVGEVVLIASAALLIGTLFAVQVPLLEIAPIDNRFYYYGILAAVAPPLAITVICAFLPSLQASRLHPAIVLHEE